MSGSGAARKQRAYVVRWISVLHSKDLLSHLGASLHYATHSPLRLAAFSAPVTALRLRDANVKREMIATTTRLIVCQRAMTHRVDFKTWRSFTFCQSLLRLADRRSYAT